MPLTVHTAVLGIGLAALVGAALHDILARTIPDIAPSLVAASGLVLRFDDGTIGTAGCAETQATAPMPSRPAAISTNRAIRKIMGPTPAGRAARRP